LTTGSSTSFRGQIQCAKQRNKMSDWKRRCLHFFLLQRNGAIFFLLQLFELKIFFFV
jgi:hypothetical protein